MLFIFSSLNKKSRLFLLENLACRIEFKLFLFNFLWLIFNYNNSQSEQGSCQPIREPIESINMKIHLIIFYFSFSFFLLFLCHIFKPRPSPFLFRFWPNEKFRFNLLQLKISSEWRFIKWRYDIAFFATTDWLNPGPVRIIRTKKSAPRIFGPVRATMLWQAIERLLWN